MPQQRKRQRVAIIALLALTLLAGALPAQARMLFPEGRTAKTHHTPTLPPNSAFFIAIGRCEQPAPADGRMANGRWPERYKWGINWRQTRNWSFPGGLGVWAPLWLERGISGRVFAPSADRATPIEQMVHAQMIVNKYGAYAWGCAGVAMAQASVRKVSQRELHRWIRLARQGAPTT